MATIIMLLCLIVIGSFFSGAFVLYFQKKEAVATVLIVLGLASLVLFYYGISVGWIELPKT